MAKLRFLALPCSHTLRLTAARAVVVGMLLTAGAVRLHAQTWNIQWSDEFNATSGTAPSSSTWSFDVGGGGWGNGELETYCAPYSSVAPCNPNASNLLRMAGGTWAFTPLTTT